MPVKITACGYRSQLKNKRKVEVKGNIAYILALERARKNGRLFLSWHHVAKKKSVAYCLRWNAKNVIFLVARWVTARKKSENVKKGKKQSTWVFKKLFDVPTNFSVRLCLCFSFIFVYAPQLYSTGRLKLNGRYSRWKLFRETIPSWRCKVECHTFDPGRP